MWSSSPTLTPPLVRIRSCPSRGLAQRLRGGVAPVGHDAQIAHLAAQAQQQARRKKRLLL
jgi:hypothetical protein